MSKLSIDLHQLQTKLQKYSQVLEAAETNADLSLDGERYGLEEVLKAVEAQIYDAMTSISHFKILRSGLNMDGCFNETENLKDILSGLRSNLVVAQSHIQDSQDHAIRARMLVMEEKHADFSGLEDLSVKLYNQAIMNKNIADGVMEMSKQREVLARAYMYGGRELEDQLLYLEKRLAQAEHSSFNPLGSNSANIRSQMFILKRRIHDSDAEHRSDMFQLFRERLYSSKHDYMVACNELKAAEDHLEDMSDTISDIEAFEERLQEATECLSDLSLLASEQNSRLGILCRKVWRLSTLPLERQEKVVEEIKMFLELLESPSNKLVVKKLGDLVRPKS